MFEFGARSQVLVERTQDFLADHIYPAEEHFARQVENGGYPRPTPPVLQELKETARGLGLWNLFLPHPEKDHEPLSNLEYAPIAELSGRSLELAPEAMNCSAPDTGNMELLSMFGTPDQKDEWLRPLMSGAIRSAYVMTEPQVASSDASNIETTIERDGDEWVINGRKWWISGPMREDCRLLILMGISNLDTEAPRHRRHSMVLIPRETPGVEVVRELNVLGFRPFETHVEMRFTDVRVPATNLLGEPGAGFAMSQARLGPGRIHHCMRMIGAAERALELMIDRAGRRSTFGSPLVERGVIREWIADSRMEIDQARLYTLRTAYLMDTVGNREAASEISGIKVVVPNMARRVVDRAMQVFGGAGLCQETPLARAYAETRIVRIADGPDEVHRRALARTELRRFERATTPMPSGAAAHLSHLSELA